MNTLICYYCDKQYRGFLRTDRAYKHHYCSKICAARGQWLARRKNTISRVCMQCNGAFTIPPKRLSQKFCSHQCVLEYQKDHPPKKRLGFIKECLICGSSFYVKRKRTTKNLYCSRTCYAIALKSGLVNTAIQFVQGESQFEHKRIQGLRKRPTRPEHILLCWLKEAKLPYRYVGDRSFLIGRYNPDFVNTNGQKKVIELNGEAFHNAEDAKKRINKFAEFGFKTLVIWTKELISKDIVIKKIRDFDHAF